MRITTEQARAIRKADAVCFDHDSDGNGQIRAIDRAPDGWDCWHEKTTTVPVTLSTVAAYDGKPRCIGFAMVMSAQHDPEWQTVARAIKAGSGVELRWVRGNASPVTDAAGLVVDHLTVVVYNGKRGNHYRVSTYIGLDNSARMLRAG